MDRLTRLDQTQDDLRRARRLMVIGEPGQAAELLAGPPPDSVDGRMEIGRRIVRAEALLYAGRVGGALEEAEAASEEALRGPLLPELELALAVRALCRLRSGDADDREPLRSELEEALDPLPTHVEAACRLHQAHAIVLMQLGRPEAARVAALRALHAAQRIDDRWREAMLLDTLGNLHLVLGDDLQALKRFDASLEIKREVGDPLGAAVTLGGRARTLLRGGDAVGSLAACDESLAASRELSNVASEVIALDLGALALLEMDRPREARARIETALALADAHPSDVTDRQRALLTKDLALTDEREGDRGSALWHLATAEELFASRNVRDGAGFCAAVAGRMLFRANQLEEACDHYRRALEFLHRHPRVDLHIDVLVRLAEIELALGREAEGEGHLHRAEHLIEMHGLRGWRSEVERVRRPQDELPERIGIRNELGLAGTEREYLLLEQVAGGGQGTVWRALDSRSHATVALKIRGLAENADQARREAEWWRTELRAAAAVDHPAVVRVFGYQRVGGMQYLILEWIEGLSLRQRLAAGAVPLPLARRLIRQMAEGLMALHAGGVVHRDIKPENVMLRDGETAVLVDFGASRLGAPEKWESYVLVGTPGYLPPEIAGGTPASAATDLFSFGLVVAEVLAGINPFHGWFEESTVTSYVERLRDAGAVELAVDEMARGVEEAAPGFGDVVAGLLSADADAREHAIRSILSHP